MTKRALIGLTAFLIVSDLARANQADDTMITITGQTPGNTPFISQLALSASDTTTLKSIQFTITPKPGSVTRPLTGTYSTGYLADRGYLLSATGQLFIPVYGLYDDFANTVTLTYYFLDGSSKQAQTTIATAVFDDPCGYKTPTVLQPRTDSTALSYDYILIKGLCSDYSPAIIDSDGALRWMSFTADNFSSVTTGFFDNAIYYGRGPILYRIDLDGTFTQIADYSGILNDFHHNIDRGKYGIILDVDTSSYVESTNMEVDGAGNILKTWNLADIISSAMTAGGDDPSQFVYPSPADWFHNNSVAYNRADDSLIISSREDFVICIDYETSAIKWILGDQTKKWYQFPSLKKYALTLAPGTQPPTGQHSVSITYDQNTMVFDNGEHSWLEAPFGQWLKYASPRKYEINSGAFQATELWNFEMNKSVYSPICGSVYEDAALNYLVDYADVNGFAVETQYAELLGLSADGEMVFYYQYPNMGCDAAFNALPVHLENAKFPTVGPKMLNLSTRGKVSNGDDTLIGGFIVAGTSSKTVALRVLGPSLSDAGLTGVVADPILTLFDSSGNVIASNDDWSTDPGAAELSANGLAPTVPTESATVQTLAPAAYTVVARSKDSSSGIGLVEAYDLTAETDSRLANISTRGSVGAGDNVLISGFIVGDVASASVILRALGPSLASLHVANPLADPVLTVHDQNGAVIATNDNWQDDVNSPLLDKNGLAPGDPAESAIALNLPAGAYSAVVSGANGTTGTALVEVYHLD